MQKKELENKILKVIKEYPDERNLQLDIEFRDRPDEAVGNRLIDLFQQLNKRKIKEELLYLRTADIDESSLP